MTQKIKEFFKTKFGIHVYSFAKTYVTVSLGIYLAMNGVQDEISKISPEILKQINLTDIVVLQISLKGGFLAVLRNVYKFLTEK